MSTIRTCNMLLIVLDCMKTLQHKKSIEDSTRSDTSRSFSFDLTRHLR